ncbi:type II secretion system protein GspL [Vibrio metschnikovii]|uniref:type II secretion system protein GspL n=1 Tax=Vibrio metschnikovii TaxID=28172 RepID=UPI001C3113F8|nr:type II secretion system protein GspL [Vibrio metschnikovii]
MSESLIVRLSSQQNAIIPWLVWSSTQQQVIASGELSNGQQLEQLTPHAVQRSTIILLSTSDLLLTQVTIPAGGSRQFAAMLPYLLEEEIAQDVDELHFSVLGKQGDQAFVAGVDRAWLQAMLEQLQALGLDVKRVVPDVLALPVHEEGLSAGQMGDQWLVRKGECSGLSVDKDWLTWFCASDWVKNQTEYLPLTAYTPLPELPLSEQQSWQSMACPSLLVLLTEQVLTHKINLLTGPFKPKSSWNKYWLIWRKAVIAGLFLLVVLMTSYGLQVHKDTQLAQSYRDESERIFREIFPDKQRIPTVSYLRRQMTDELTALSGSAQGEDVLSWFSRLPETIGSVTDMQVQSLRFDGNRSEVRLDVTSSDFQSFEQARVKLAEYFLVEQGQLSRNEQRVSGSFVLKPKEGSE